MSKSLTEYDYFKNEKGHTEPKTDRTKKKWLRCKEATVEQ